MNSNKGITLTALVITIIVILILSTTAAYIGYDAIQTSAEQKFLSMLKQVNEAVSLHMQDYKNLNLTKLEPEENYDNISYKYKLETKEDYEKIGLDDTHDIIYVNFDTGQIYSKKGINEKHTLRDFGVEYYKPTQEITSDENNEISFEIKLNAQQYSWKYIINYETIKCRGNPENGNLLYSEYSEDGKYKWKRVPKAENGYELETKQPGVYELKFRDDTGQESEVKQVYSYVKDGLKLYYDGEYNENYKHNGEATTWQDLSGNNNKGIINGGKWNTNYLEFDGIDDYVKTTSEVNYNSSKNVTTQIVDLEGTIEQNENASIIIESSENWNTNLGTFGVDINEYGNKEITVTYYDEKGYNVKGTNDNFLEQNKSKMYTFIIDTEENNNFIKIYKNEQLADLFVRSEHNTDIFDSKINNYILYIASRNGSMLFCKMKMANLRVYNRALTEEEIAKNYEIDKIRFNIK